MTVQFGLLPVVMLILVHYHSDIHSKYSVIFNMNL